MTPRVVRPVIALALILGFIARGVLDAWPSTGAVMPIVLVLTWVALTNVAAWPRPRKPKPLADPDEQWRSAADES